MFKFIPSSEMGGDCTRSYDIELDKEYTVGEFIKTILENRSNEWGTISIYCKCPEFEYPHVNYVDRPKCEYKQGKILNSSFQPEHLEFKVKNVVAHGGWSLMDYTINFNYDEVKQANSAAFKRFINEIVEKRKERLEKERTVDISPVVIPVIQPFRKKR